MTSPLHSLLDLRFDAEQAARLNLEDAIAARVKEDEEQARLVESWRLARAKLLREESRGEHAPKSAAQAQTRERYRERLEEEATGAALSAEEHLEGALACARRAESEARAAYEAARVALEAAAKLQERADAEAAKLVERRDEEAAGDHATAAFVRNRNRP
jgi:flagellar biosynthesis chaperone FliJ